MEIQRNAMEYYIFKQLKYTIFDGKDQKNTTKYKNQGKYRLECDILDLAKRSICTEKSGVIGFLILNEGADYEG